MVEENEYRSAYREISQRRCLFEKALLTRRCNCSKSKRFYLADREGVACEFIDSQQRCRQFLGLLRQNARFALKLTGPIEELPHAKEIRVQRGGLRGLHKSLHPESDGHDQIEDIDGLIHLAIQEFGALESCPFDEIVKSIVGFEGRRRPRSRR